MRPVDVSISLRPIRSTFLNFLFFFNNPAPTEIYTLSLHDALPISSSATSRTPCRRRSCSVRSTSATRSSWTPRRSEEHTSELQSRGHLVCRLLLEKKKNDKTIAINNRHTQTTMNMTECVHHDRTQL